MRSGSSESWARLKAKKCSIELKVRPSILKIAGKWFDRQVYLVKKTRVVFEYLVEMVDGRISSGRSSKSLGENSLPLIRSL